MGEIAAQGMLDVNAPRNTTTGGPGEYTPTTEEKRAIKLVENLFDKARKHRQLYDQKWLDYYHMFRGKQWKELRPSYRHTEVINLIFRTIQSQTAIQMDNRPRFEFLPQEPSDIELAEIMNQLAEADWERECWMEQLLEIIYDGNFYGTGLSRMVEKDCHGTNKLVYESVDPFYCFPDPDARDCNKDCGYFVHAEPRDVRKVRKENPDKAEFIKPDIVDLMKGSKTDNAPIKFRSPVDQRVQVEGSTAADLIDKDRVLVVTAYLSPEFCEDEYEEIERNTIDPENNAPKVEYEQRAKYPLGRIISVANGVLLSDEPAEYDDAEIPFERYTNYELPREFWGMSEVEQLEGPQKVFNKLVSFALDVLTLMGNPVWINPLDSGVDPENLVNRPGLVVEPSTKDSAPYREEGVQLQPFVLQLIDRMAEWFNDVSGSSDVSRGAQPTGVTAASAINKLQEAAQTRIRQKSRNLDTYLQKVGQHYASRVFQFRTAPEVYRITNKQGAMKFFKAHVEEYEKTEVMPHPETGEPAEMPTGEKGRRLVYQPMGPNGVAPDQLRKFEIQGKLDVRVSTGSALPFARDEKEQKLLNLYNAGIIDAEEVLKGSDYPNYEAVLSRMQEKAAQDAAAQQQQGQPPAA